MAKAHRKTDTKTVLQSARFESLVEQDVTGYATNIYPQPRLQQFSKLLFQSTQSRVLDHCSAIIITPQNPKSTF